jgi:hypothetical protein
MNATLLLSHEVTGPVAMAPYSKVLIKTRVAVNHKTRQAISLEMNWGTWNILVDAIGEFTNGK